MSKIKCRMNLECRSPKHFEIRISGFFRHLVFRHSTLGERIEVFLQKLLKILPMNLLRLGEVNPQDVPVGARVVDLAVDAEFDNAAEGEFALGASEVEREGLRALRLDRSPRLALLRHDEMD